MAFRECSIHGVAMICAWNSICCQFKVWKCPVDGCPRMKPCKYGNKKSKSGRRSPRCVPSDKSREIASTVLQNMQRLQERAVRVPPPKLRQAVKGGPFVSPVPQSQTSEIGCQKEKESTPHLVGSDGLIGIDSSEKKLAENLFEKPTPMPANTSTQAELWNDYADKINQRAWNDQRVRHRDDG